MNSGYEVAFREIDDILRSPAPPLERLNSALRQLAKYRSALIQQALIAAEGTQVLEGPFRGMRLPTHSIEGCYIPKLLGCYEAELHPHIQAAVARDYRNII